MALISPVLVAFAALAIGGCRRSASEATDPAAVVPAVPEAAPAIDTPQAPVGSTEIDAIREPRPPAPAGEGSLGVRDRGIFSDLDPRVQITLPAGLTPRTASAVVDPDRGLLVLYQGDFPVKVYPLAGQAELEVDGFRLRLRALDRAELAPLLRADRIRQLAPGSAPAPGDADRDGIPDPIDVLIGGLKNAINAAPYRGGYTLLDFPGGDVPRDMGVCTDVIVRAARNAGLDLQAEVQREIRTAPRGFPMVQRPSAHIDHRRVKTILPYFLRTWDRRTVALDDAADPLRPGDVVFMDTFPSRSGPDHIGIVSDKVGPSRQPLIINSWTDGFRASEMDLLGFVPVTHRFRFPSLAR